MNRSIAFASCSSGCASDSSRVMPPMIWPAWSAARISASVCQSVRAGSFAMGPRLRCLFGVVKSHGPRDSSMPGTFDAPSARNRMNQKWQAVAREADVASEQMAIGSTALKKASYARPAYYGQVFFALSSGFERAAKLALMVDYAIDHAGTYPDQKTVRDYLHD